MSKLVSFGDDRIPRANSLALAEAVGKPHNIVLREIKELSMPDEFRAKHFRAAGSKGVEFTEEGFAYISQCFRSRQANEAKVEFLAEFARLRQHSSKYRDEDITFQLGSLWQVVHIAQHVVEGKFAPSGIAEVVARYEKAKAELEKLAGEPLSP